MEKITHLRPGEVCNLFISYDAKTRILYKDFETGHFCPVEISIQLGRALVDLNNDNPINNLYEQMVLNKVICGASPKKIKVEKYHV